MILGRSTRNVLPAFDYRRRRWPIAVVLAVVLISLSAGAQPAYAGTINHNPISTAVTANGTHITPMWGPQIPKIVYDGPSGWYYAVTLDGSGATSWVARIWESNDGWNWTNVKTLNGWVEQPPSLILDSGNRLWLTALCWTGGTSTNPECYPGVPSAAGNAFQYLYLVRVELTSRLANGSFNFNSPTNRSPVAPSDRAYRGDTIDASRRYIWSAYSNPIDWGFYFSSYDTWTNTESTRQIGTPGTNEQYLYPRVRRGTAPGEVWLLFNQELHPDPSCTGSACVHGVQLWRSTDGGVTWPQSQRFMVASVPDPDGSANWCDAADLEVDSSDRPHVLFFKEVNSTAHLYYWRGTSGNVVLPGSPQDLGPYDNHSQLMLAPLSPPSNEDVVFATNGGPNLTVMRSTDGTSWSTESFPVSGASTLYSPNLMRTESGSWPVGNGYDFPMLLSEIPTGGSTYSTLDFLIYYG